MNQARKSEHAASASIRGLEALSITSTAAPAATAAARSETANAPPVSAVAERFVVPTGTVLVRLAADVSSATAKVGDRFQGFLDKDLAADGHLVAPRGAKVYGVVSAVDDGNKMKGQPTLGVTLSDMKVGDRVVSIKTQPVNAKGGTATGARKVVGGARTGRVIPARSAEHPVQQNRSPDCEVQLSEARAVGA